VLKGNTIVLNPIVNEGNMTYLWAPNVFIDDNTKKNPTITGDVDRVYTLQVTDSLGCVATDQASIIVSPPVIIPNTFTPNGDGINDIWQIPGLMAYPNATVDIFDRYGQKIFHTIGYGKPWDGTYNGKQLPAGTYYYVIDAKIYNRVYSGYVAILR
jgi:gliding motility-associated-like protein